MSRSVRHPATRDHGSMARFIGLAFAGTGAMLAFAAYGVANFSPVAQPPGMIARAPATELRITPAVSPVATLGQR